MFVFRRESAEYLADKLKKITVAEVIESMEVSLLPLATQDSDCCRIYKLEMKLYIPAHYPKYANMSVEDWEETLEVAFVRELEDAIQNHMLLLSRISGIKNFLPDSQSRASNEADEDGSGERSHKAENDDDDEEEDDGEKAEDLGLDAEKRKVRATDEMDYDDGFEDHLNEVESIASEESSGFESEIDQGDNEIDIRKDAVLDNEASESPLQGKPSKPKSKIVAPETPSRGESHSEPKSRDKKKKQKAKRSKGPKLVKKDYDRAIYVETRNMHFEVHFKFTNEPHILLAEVCNNLNKFYFCSKFVSVL